MRCSVNSGSFLAIYVYTPSIRSIYLCVLVVIFPVKDLSETTLLMILKFRTKLCCVLGYQPHIAYSRGTKVEKMETLAPERYTAGFGMVAKVILWCI